MPRPWTLGIDFGTSYTAVAGCVEGDGPEVVEVEGTRRMPSIVFVDEHDNLVVGRAAEEMLAVRPPSVLRAPKARLGEPTPVVLAGRPWPVAVLVAKVLEVCHAAAVQHFGSLPAHIRLTYPATWSRSRLSRLSEAARLAGLGEPSFVPEPVAAALSYWRRGELAPGSHVGVYDLGGGTFDTAILRALDDGFQIVGRPTGESSIGGELFDELVVQAIGQRLDAAEWEQVQLGEGPVWAHVRAVVHSEARRVKETLSSRPWTEVAVQLPSGLRTLRMERDELETMLEPYVEDTVEVFARCVSDAGLAPEDLAAIQLVGGASSSPIVERLMSSAFPNVPVQRRGDPKTAVAVGAALAPDFAALPLARAGHDTPTPRPTPAPPPTPPPAPLTGLPARDVLPTAVAGAAAGGLPNPTALTRAEVGIVPSPPGGGPVATPQTSPRRRRALGWVAGAAVVVALVVALIVTSTGGGDKKSATTSSPTAATTTSAAAPSPSTTAAGPATSAGASEPLAALAAACAAEGKVNLIALPDDWVNYSGVLQSFRDKYPGVETPVANPNAASSDQLDAVVNLHGQPDMPDSIDVSPSFAVNATNDGLWEPYEPSVAAEVPDGLVDPGSNWVAAYYGVIGFLTNTDVVTAAPQTWADLEKPAYRGKVALIGDPRESGSGLAAVVAAALANGGTADDIMPGIQYFAGLKRSGNLILDDVVDDTLVSGTTPILIDWSYNFPRVKRSLDAAGTRFDVSYPSDGVYGGYYAQGVVKGSPHQSCAKLWVEHLLSVEGALAYLAGGALPARYTALLEAGKVPASLQVDEPSAAVAASATFLTPSQRNAAAQLVEANWGAMVVDA